MLLYIMRYFFSLFVVILFYPFLLFAEDLIPEKFHGTWSNDCSKEQDIFIITESSYFNLYESQDEIDEYAYFYLQFSDSKTYKDWIYLDGEIFEFKVLLNRSICLLIPSISFKAFFILES